MESTHFIYLQSSQWTLYKQIRLDALKNDPDSFGRTYDEESTQEDDFWIARLEKSGHSMIFVQVAEKIVGMGGIYYKDNDPQTAHIWGIYIQKEFRGKGLGLQLMDTLIQTILHNPNISTIELEVNASKIPAVKLYEKLGFKKTKKHEKALHNTFDTYSMEKKIA